MTPEQHSFHHLAQGLDLVVIGGGITRAGIFHQAALRGLRVGLVEPGGFCLRYLLTLPQAHPRRTTLFEALTTAPHAGGLSGAR